MRPNPRSRRTLPDFASGETINSTSDRVRDGGSAQGLASLFHVTRRTHRYRTLPLHRLRSVDIRTRCGKRKRVLCLSEDELDTEQCRDYLMLQMFYERPKATKHQDRDLDTSGRVSRTTR